MTGLAATFRALAHEIAMRSAVLGRPVDIDVASVADRTGMLDLKPPGLWSPNRSCRLVRAADGWIAVNLPRETDREMVPAWLEADVDADWPTIIRSVRERPWRGLVDQARLLALPIAGVGEVSADRPDAVLERRAAGARRSGPLNVIDLSSMWAGPLCGGVLAAMGASVTKLESRGRPDPTRLTMPALHARLNGGKSLGDFDPGDRGDVARLGEAMATADVVITGARPRAFQQMGLTPDVLFAANPGLVWVAISGYGWTSEASDRVAFGDDAAAAGGLVRRARGQPRFLGDALADPITGLAAAAGAMRALQEGGGFLVDAALARCAAGAARAA